MRTNHADRIFDLRNGDLLFDLYAHSDVPEWSPDGQNLVLGGYAGGGSYSFSLYALAGTEARSKNLVFTSNPFAGVTNVDRYTVVWGGQSRVVAVLNPRRLRKTRFLASIFDLSGKRLAKMVGTRAEIDAAIARLEAERGGSQ
jgi:hypothetical protein